MVKKQLYAITEIQMTDNGNAYHTVLIPDLFAIKQSYDNHRNTSNGDTIKMMTRPVTYQELERIKQYGRLCWENLSDDERELWYCTDGTYGFVEQVICMLRLLDAEMTDEQFDNLNDYICWNDTHMEVI